MHSNPTTAHHREQYCTYSRICFHEKSPSNSTSTSNSQGNENLYIICIAILSALVIILSVILGNRQAKYVDHMKREHPEIEIKREIPGIHQENDSQIGRGDVNTSTRYAFCIMNKEILNLFTLKKFFFSESHHFFLENAFLIKAFSVGECLFLEIMGLMVGVLCNSGVSFCYRPRKK